MNSNNLTKKCIHLFFSFTRTCLFLFEICFLKIIIQKMIQKQVSTKKIKKIHVLIIFMHLHVKIKE